MPRIWAQQMSALIALEWLLAIRRCATSQCLAAYETLAWLTHALHQRRNTMEKLTTKVLFARVAVASLCACAATLAQAGGNGNGGNGSGGAHGAATAGMTYHSEPVSSPWNRVPGDMSKSADTAHRDMPGMTPDDSSMSKGTGQ